jgi:hypothetical protein
MTVNMPASFRDLIIDPQLKNQHRLSGIISPVVRQFITVRGAGLAAEREKRKQGTLLLT